MMQRYARLVGRTALALSVVAIATASGCGKDEESAAGPGDPGAGPGGKRPPRAFPVEVEPVEARDVEYAITGVGSVAAFEEVKVTARVAGVVEKVQFVEGQQVKKGQVLATIEPARYQLAVSAGRAALEKAEAAKADAEAGQARRERASEQNPGLVPGEELETWRTRARTAAAEVSAARVALQKAQLDLREAYVRAPIAGVMQTRTAQTGTYAQPGTVLGTLVRREPLLLRFQVAETDAARIEIGQVVHFVLRGEREKYSARITHVAAVADEASRMVVIRAEVDDERKDQLRPGAFAQVSVPVGASEDAPVIPQVAVRPSERGFLAFVVENGVARERVLSLGLRTADGKVEVKSGLQPGERLVVRGAEALREGAPVKIAGEDGPPGGPGGAPGSAPGNDAPGATPATPGATPGAPAGQTQGAAGSAGTAGPAGGPAGAAGPAGARSERAP
jgi:membrane fusion protein, multidrug efflux system